MTNMVPEPGACGDPKCYVLHDDPANPIHPPWYVDSRSDDLDMRLPVPFPDGLQLITAERHRQMNAEGWTREHDAEYSNDELARAACAYATPPWRRRPGVYPPWEWPWLPSFWKPTPDDRVRELVKAGALIAAEIDRLLVSGQPVIPAKNDATR